MADERDGVADRRAMQIAKQKDPTEEPARQVPALEHERRLAELMERGRARLKSSAARHEHNEAFIRRVRAVAQPVPFAIGDAPIRRGRRAPAQEPPPAHALGLSTDLRRKMTANAQRLARVEDDIASQNEVLASMHPERADEYRRIAERARDEAERSRERAHRIGDTLGDDGLGPGLSAASP